VADVADLVRFQHERQITHLHDPYPIGVHYGLDVLYEPVRILKIVEHGDTRYDFGTVLCKLRVTDVRVRLEISDVQAVGDSPGIDREVFGRVEADLIYVILLISGQEGAVVATDIEDGIVLFQMNQEFGLYCDVGECVPHGLVRARPVPVVLVHQLGRRGVSQLEQPASPAKHQFQGSLYPSGSPGEMKLETYWSPRDRTGSNEPSQTRHVERVIMDSSPRLSPFSIYQDRLPPSSTPTPRM
jgi:hypothetical protein